MQPERAARYLAAIGGILLLLVLILRGLSLTAAFEENGSPPTALTESSPILGDYSFSSDGRRIVFRQALEPVTSQNNQPPEDRWYSMELEGGPISRVGEPSAPDIQPFVIRNNQLFLLVGEGVSLATGSPPDMRVTHAALAPDGLSMAFSATEPDGDSHLYILYTDEQLDWLGEEESINDLAWSPDSEHLVYVAPREGVSQLLCIDRNGRNLQQLTFDDTEKRNPIWLAGELGIAYVAIEPSSQPNADIFLLDETGANLRRLTDDQHREFGLSAVMNGQEIGYTIQPDIQIKNVFHLYVIDPQNARQRRVYPPLSIDSLQCPERLARGSTSDITFNMTNSSLLPVGVPVILRSGPASLPVYEERQANAIRIETIDNPALDSREVKWSAPGAGGLTTHVSVLIDQGEFFPMSEQHCVIRNTYLGLPNLAFLPAVLPLTAGGMLLTVPWLRHKKQRRLWALWLAYPLLVAILIWVEAARAHDLIAY